MFLNLGCSRHKAYVFVNKTKVKRIKPLIKEDIKSLDIGKGNKLVKNYTYQLPKDICAFSEIDSLKPYINHVYRLTQKREFHKYVGEKVIIQEGDTIIRFNFKYPSIIHGQEIYIYNKEDCSIKYISIYKGKF